MKLYDISALHYETDDARMWREWFVANEIPLGDTPRANVELTDDGKILVLQYVKDADGKRIVHSCCDDGHAHFAKRTGIFPLLVEPPDSLDSWLVKV